MQATAERAISATVEPGTGKGYDVNFYETVRQTVLDYINSSDALRAATSGGGVTIDWYDDEPVASLVVMIVRFSAIEGVDVANDLIVFLRKSEFRVTGIDVSAPSVAAQRTS